jgi:hypothetical protein
MTNSLHRLSPLVLGALLAVTTLVWSGACSSESGSSNDRCADEPANEASVYCAPSGSLPAPPDAMTPPPDGYERCPPGYFCSNSAGPSGEPFRCDPPGNPCDTFVSRREFKTAIRYVDAQERAALAAEALSIPIASYAYKTDPPDARRRLGFIIDDQPDPSFAVDGDRTHVDLYGYTSMLLATVQEQQRAIAELKQRVEMLEGKH